MLHFTAVYSVISDGPEKVQDFRNIEIVVEILQYNPVYPTSQYLKKSKSQNLTFCLFIYVLNCIFSHFLYMLNNTTYNNNNKVLMYLDLRGV